MPPARTALGQLDATLPEFRLSLRLPVRLSHSMLHSWLLLGNILHFCLLWFSGKFPLNC